MRKVLLLPLLVVSLTGCGLQNQINDLKSRSNQSETEIDNLQERVAALEAFKLSTQDQLASLDNALSAQGANLQGQLDSVSVSIANLGNSNSSTQVQLTALSAALATLGNDLSVLEGRVDAVEGDTTSLGLSIGGVQSDLTALTSLVASYASLGNNAYNQIQAALLALQSSSSGLSTQVTTLQTALNTANVKIATLQGYNNIVSIKDPCGAQGAYNEVFLKLSTGKYLASQSDNASGLNTRFVLLQDGTYVTTDGTHCTFTVSGSGTVISNEHN